MKALKGGNPITGKVVQSINFDIIVLRRLEEVAKREGMKVSQLVNLLCQRLIMTDVQFYTEMARYHASKLAEFQYLRGIEVRQE